jgi:hypothetical protein
VAGGTQFLYSNTRSHTVAAVLAAALQRADDNHLRSILDDSRDNCSIRWRLIPDPAFANQLPDTNAEKFADAGFGWGTDPHGRLYAWNGHKIYAAPGSEGHLVFVSPIKIH